MSEQLRYEYGDKTVLELQNLQEHGHLNLEPGFQRKSVWSDSDRRKLIQSVLEGYPVPSIFLYRRDDNGRPVYDVVDGKQRLETIFMFTRTRGFKNQGFDVPFRFPEDDATYWYNWRELNRWSLTSPVLTYKIQTVEVSGDLANIVDLFVRINSTGKALTMSERRHAKFFTSPFLKLAEKLARKHGRYFASQGIIRAAQVARMKDVELVCELLASIANGAPIDQKAAVDRAVASQALNAGTAKRIVREFDAVSKAMRRMFPGLHSTRFRNIAEFYTLFMVVWELQKANLILKDRRRNRVAAELLRGLSNGVDEVREQQKKAKGARADQRIFATYLLSVQQSTDKLPQRRQRAEIVRGILSGLFARRDEQRLFSPEQRRLLWNSEDKKKCGICGKPLSWTNFQVDHIHAHSRGGRTQLYNAALVCQPCNAAKGARRRRRRRKG